MRSVAVMVWPKDSSGTETLLRFTDVPRFDPSGAAPAFWAPAVCSSWRLVRGVVDPNSGEVLGTTEPPSGTISLDRTGGFLDDWKNYEWEGARFEVYVSENETDWSNFQLAFRGSVAAVEPETERLNFKIGSANEFLDKLVSYERYRGFGGRAWLTPGKYGSASAETLLPSGDGLSFEIFGRLLALPEVKTSFFLHSEILGLGVDAYGDIKIILSGSSVKVPVRLEAGREFYFALTLASDFRTVKVFSRNSEGEVKLEKTHLLASSLASDFVTEVTVNSWAGSSGAMELWELRLFRGARSLAKFKETSEGSYGDSDDMKADNGAALWRFEERSGAAAKDSIGEALLEFAAGEPAWGPSLDGDDPSEFPGEAGVYGPKAWAFGAVYNAPGTVVSMPDSKWQFSGAPSVALRKLYVQGLQLPTDKQLVASAEGDFISLGDGWIVCSPEYTFNGFVPGQSFPSRPGQPIWIADWPEVEGHYEVSFEGVSSDGMRLKIEALRDTHRNVCPSGASIFTPPGSELFIYDNALSLATFTGTPEAGVTADFIGGESRAEYRLKDAFEVLSGGVPEASGLVFNPSLGLYSGQTEPKTRRQLLDEAARSGAAYWWERRDGRLALANWRAPGAPRFVLTNSGLARLSLANLSLLGEDAVVAELESLGEHRAGPLAHEIVCNYLRAQLPQDDSSLAGLVSPLRRRWLKDGWARERRYYPRGPQTYPLEPIDTALWRQAEARTWINYIAWLFAERRRVYQAAALGLPFGYAEIGDSCLLESQRESDLAGGKSALVIHVEEDTSAAQTVLWLLT